MKVVCEDERICFLSRNSEDINSPEHYVITEHARLRFFERGISIDDIQKAIADGEIIRQYEDDKPFPSCLILSYTSDERPIHLVVSTDDKCIYLITAYIPDADIWDDDFKTKKEGNS